MNINFVDKDTVKINHSLPFSGGRPKDKIVLHDHEILAEFNKKHPSYDILSFDGPRNITNFHSHEASSGVWTLSVEKKFKSTKAPAKNKKNYKKVQGD